MKKKMFFSVNNSDSDFLAYYRLLNNTNDDAQQNNGTAFNISYVNNTYGGISGSFNTNSYFEASTQDYLSFSDGSNDLPFAVGFNVNKIGTSSYMIINKRSNSLGFGAEWSINIDSLERPTIFCFDSLNGGFISQRVNSSIPLNTDIIMFFTYNSVSGFKIYFDGALQTNVTNTTIGFYDKMVVSPAPLVVGKNGFSNSNYLDGQISEISIFKKELNLSEIQDLTNKIQNNISLI